jgi:hypothetical protein
MKEPDHGRVCHCCVRHAEACSRRRVGSGRQPRVFPCCRHCSQSSLLPTNRQRGSISRGVIPPEGGDGSSESPAGATDGCEPLSPFQGLPRHQPVRDPGAYAPRLLTASLPGLETVIRRIGPNRPIRRIRRIRPIGGAGGSGLIGLIRRVGPVGPLGWIGPIGAVTGADGTSAEC